MTRLSQKQREQIAGYRQGDGMAAAEARDQRAFDAARAEWARLAEMPVVRVGYFPRMASMPLRWLNTEARK